MLSENGKKQKQDRNVNVPQLRFAGFNDEWEKNKAGEIFKSVSDKGHAELPVLSASQQLGMIRRDKSGIDIKYNEKSIKNYKRVKPGQFVIHLRSFQGGFAWSDIEGITSPAYTVIDFKDSQNHISNFWKQVMTSSVFVKRLETVTYGIRDGRSISFSDFSMLNFVFPSGEEQKQIGKFFNKIDYLINLYQSKINLLIEKKQAYLQKVFPRKDKNVPVLRFSGFTDDWEQRQLGDVSEIVGGGTPSTGISDYWDGNIDWYSPVEIGNQNFVHRSQKKISELGLQKSSAKILPIGTILFTSRAGIGNTAILAKEGCTNQGFQSIVPHKDRLNTYFVFSMTNKLKRYGEVKGAGSTFVEVSGKQMAKMPILLPSIEEQRKIGNFFKQLDHLITLHQRKLDVLKERKKAYLQKMFV